jgi:hypothetical protein
MSNHYYNAEDLKKFGNVSEFQKNLGDKFFDYYGEVFKDSELTAKEKSLPWLFLASCNAPIALTPTAPMPMKKDGVKAK